LFSVPVCTDKHLPGTGSPYYSISAIRGIKTESLAFKDAQEILNKQRLHRPSSPHFTIYKPQIPWILSITNRVTGVGLSVGMLY
jgi:hypothetical protein